MERKTTMVREYATQQEFHADEQTLSRQGWLADPVDQADKPGLIERVVAFFNRTQATAAAANIVVTYRREQPS